MPIGVLLILLACFGVSSLIALSSISFPASVMCMLLLFFGLMLSDLVVGERRTREFVRVIDVPVRFSCYQFYSPTSNECKAGFSLRYINLFFTPSFVLLPLSNPIGGVEVAKIIGVFGMYRETPCSV